MTGSGAEWTWTRSSRAGALCGLTLIGAAACGRIGVTATAVDASEATELDARIPQTPLFVQHTAGSSTTATVSVTFDQLVPQGDLIVAALDYKVASAPSTVVPSSVTDSLGNSFTVVGPFDGPLSDTVNNRQYIAYAISQASGNDTVSATINAPPDGYYELRLHEYASVSLTRPFEAAAGAAGSVTGTDAAQTGTIATSEANELIFGFVICGAPVTTGTGFTLRGNDFNDLTEELIATSPGDYHAVASPQGDWVATVAAFRGR